MDKNGEALMKKFRAYLSDKFPLSLLLLSAPLLRLCSGALQLFLLLRISGRVGVCACVHVYVCVSNNVEIVHQHEKEEKPPKKRYKNSLANTLRCLPPHAGRFRSTFQPVCVCVCVRRVSLTFLGGVTLEKSILSASTHSSNRLFHST
jgi:hypothetical protein